jgi:hypothetical protein
MPTLSTSWINIQGMKPCRIWSWNVTHHRYTPAPISIKHLLDHGKASDTRGSFLFLRKEIPTRLANMIMELKLLPVDLRKQRECDQIPLHYELQVDLEQKTSII